MRRVSLTTCLALILTVFSLTTVNAQIKMSDNRRFLADEAGRPFFWLGDTDWELFHRLNREETETFLETRKKQGFNVIQAVALAEFNGIRQPNRYGDWPLNNEDPTQLNTTPGKDPGNSYEYDYWDHVDFVVDKIIEKGMYVGLLPTWGDKVAHLWGDGPIIFNEANAEAYARILATRYKQKNKHIIWILGGDRPPVYTAKVNNEEVKFDDRAIWRAMAKGIEEVLGKEAFITYHPNGGHSSSENIHEDAWLDLNTFQSGHGDREAESWGFVTRDLSLKPQKPVLDMEPCYEDHPVNPWDGKWTRARGYFSAYDVRARIYRGVFAGAAGVTYGHHQIWQFLNKDLYEPINVGDTLIGWQKASEAVGAFQMKHLKNLMLSRPYFVRIPDQTIILSNPGSNYKDLVVGTRDSNNSYAFIYLPQNKPVTVDLSRISGATKKVYWYSPETGNVIQAPDSRSGQRTFTPPKDGSDWVLVIDDASRKYPPPGTVD